MQHLDVGVLGEACHSAVFAIDRPLRGRVERRDDHIALAAHQFGQLSGCFGSGSNQILPGKGDAIAVRVVGVVRNDGNALLQEAVDDRRQRAGADGRNREAIDA